MTLTQQPQPTRSSLLFSPVISSSPPSSSPSDVNITNNHNTNNNNSPDDSEYKHHRRRSDFRSKSTDQIIPNPLNTTNPVISSTTLYPSPQSSKFSNINVSQPTFRPAPLAPVPIPATRFDTITSYVDVIYQHQQQQQHQQQHQHQQNQDQNHIPMSSDQDDIEAQDHGSTDDDGIVYLDPSDGIDGDQSFMATCPQCAMMVMTEIAPFPGKKSKRMACLLTPVLLCWLPFYSLKIGKKWMDVKHTCPKCQYLIAIYRK